MATIRTLAEELDADIVEVREYLHSVTGSTAGTDAPLDDDEVEVIRYHWSDPTPQHQWQVTEGGGPGWSQDKRDEHDESL